MTVTARLTKIPAGTIRRWAREGRITAQRVSGQFLVNPLEVLALAELRMAGGRLPKTPR